jgi:RHS repeat-associated protein
MYFGYDPLGRCVKRWVGDSGDIYSNPAIYFHYDGWNLLQEGANAWGPARVYVHGNRVDEIVWSYQTATGEQAYHHYDARGHCTLLSDSHGAVLEQCEYDAFGQPYFYDASGNSIGSYDARGRWAGYSLFANRFLFTGREWLPDLKLYDYRNRLYQPELGRFLQPDPKEFAAGDYNLYRYCHNDPVNRVDPLGLDFTDPGLGQYVERIPGYLATTSVAVDVVPVKQDDGTFTLRLDVTVVDRQVAERAFYGGKDVVRTKEQMDASCEHEEKEHSKDWREFHDSKQNEVPNTRYPTLDAAKEAAKPVAKTLRQDAQKARDEFERHKPDSRWLPILKREHP